MPIRHACFISYRHSQYELMGRFVEQLYEALAGELEALTDLKIYLDKLRLQGGDFYNTALARCLCESACMIMIFTPSYFSAEHRYCAREFKAMRMLEVQRTSAGTENSLIIPVVLRRFDDLPASIRSHRQVYRFEQYSVSGRRIVRDRRFDADIRKMAEYIADRTREVRDHAIDCNEFRLPADEDVADLVSSMAGRPALFPGRERSE